jgi:hypothetical protein
MPDRIGTTVCVQVYVVVANALLSLYADDYSESYVTSYDCTVASA